MLKNRESIMFDMTEFRRAVSMVGPLLAALGLVALGLVVIVLLDSVSLFGINLTKIGLIYISVGILAVLVAAAIIGMIVGESIPSAGSAQRGRGR
jgi:CBS domain containing-hemolysin-like protein